MFPIEYQVNVRRGGEVQKYKLLENQDDKYLVVIHPAMLSQMSAYLDRGNQFEEGLIALLADEAIVLDRKKGTILPLEKANRVLAASEHVALRRAALFREPLPELVAAPSGEDLALAFSLEKARRAIGA